MNQERLAQLIQVHQAGLRAHPEDRTPHAAIPGLKCSKILRQQRGWQHQLAAAPAPGPVFPGCLTDRTGATKNEACTAVLGQKAALALANNLPLLMGAAE